ncbi:MAG TPA: aldehyde dehydrogenase family protein [Planctomycetota bacterium]|nr:aldehyde dehydrogenase family protein [Planctomycetota bacterium]
MDPLTRLGIAHRTGGCVIGNDWRTTAGESLIARSPIDGARLATLSAAQPVDVTAAIAAAQQAFLTWRTVPAPRRGEFVRRLGERFRARKTELAELITLEVGKIPQEALGEVQECIDICEFAVGLSRQLHGLTIASERPAHRMMEQWHPLGPVVVITAFNFPMAVWAWNAALALVCGDPVVWKPSEKAMLCAYACHQVAAQVMAEMADVPAGLLSVVHGRGPIGTALTSDSRVPLISATGSVRMGLAVAAAAAPRLARTLLELGGNNALIVTPNANLDLALRAIVFAAVGTSGQRCTSLRRLIVHRSIHATVVAKLTTIYAKLRIGDPREDGVLVGPLIDDAAAAAMDAALTAARSQGGTVIGGGRINDGVPAGAYVRPALVTINHGADIVQHETFAPILYVCPYDTIEQAIAYNNGVPQGLSSAIFTSDVREAELFLSTAGSDCGIANVNIGTSGAEIGGAFGGEKLTGGGRESGSDAWKSYMRRTTNTINYSTELPLAQGITFDV